MVAAAGLAEIQKLCKAGDGPTRTFQITSFRAERASVIGTTNLPFSEWTTMFPDARLCKAILDRLTDQAHMIETGNE